MTVVRVCWWRWWVCGGGESEIIVVSVGAEICFESVVCGA